MQTTNPFPLQIVPKVNDPKILELIQQFGHQYYLDANDVKVLTDALNFLLEKSNISLVDGFYAGSLNPTDDLPSIQGSFFAFLVQPGTYTNFDNLILEPNSIGIISRDSNGAFSLSQTTLNLTGYAKLTDLEGITFTNPQTIGATTYDIPFGLITDPAYYLNNESFTSDKYVTTIKMHAESTGDVVIVFGSVFANKFVERKSFTIPTTGGAVRTYNINDYLLEGEIYGLKTPCYGMAWKSGAPGKLISAAGYEGILNPTANQSLAIEMQINDFEKTGYAPIQEFELLKSGFDNNSKSLDFFVNDSDSIKIDTSNARWFKQLFHFDVKYLKRNNFLSTLTIKNIEDNLNLKFIGKQIAVYLAEELSIVKTIIGKKADGTFDSIFDSFLHSGTNPTIQEYNFDIANYVEIYITQVNPDIGSVQIFVDNVEGVAPNSVKKYIDKSIKIGYEPDNVIVVNKLTDIDGIQKAFLLAWESPKPTTIKVMPGIYEGFNDLFNNVDVRAKISLIGFDKSSTVILQEYGDYNRPPLQVHQNFYAENLIFEANSNKETNSPAAYAVHSDFGYFPTLIEYFNCDFISKSLSQAYGAGSWQDHTLRFRNCVLRKKTTSADFGAMFWHNQVPNNISNQRLEMLHCEFYSDGGPTLQIHDSNQDSGGNTNPALSQASVLFVGNTFKSGDTSANLSFKRLETLRQPGALVGNIFLDSASHGNNITDLNF